MWSQRWLAGAASAHSDDWMSALEISRVLRAAQKPGSDWRQHISFYFSSLLIE